MKEIAVLGLGNLMRTDDAVGMLTLEQMRASGVCPDNVRLIEGGTLGIDLLDSLRGVTHLAAVDAVDIGEEPGTVSRFSGEQLSAIPTSKSVHLLGFADLLGVLRLIDASPEDVVLFGIQPAHTGWGTELTPPVAAQQKALMDAVVSQIRAWNDPANQAYNDIVPMLAAQG